MRGLCGSHLEIQYGCRIVIFGAGIWLVEPENLGIAVGITLITALELELLKKNHSQGWQLAAILKSKMAATWSAFFLAPALKSRGTPKSTSMPKFVLLSTFARFMPDLNPFSLHHKGKWPKWVWPWPFKWPWRRLIKIDHQPNRKPVPFNNNLATCSEQKVLLWGNGW